MTTPTGARAQLLQRMDTRAAQLADQEPAVEHAQLYSGGSMLVRPATYDLVYPLDEWIEHSTRHGGRVFRRTILVIEDWHEVTPR